MEMQEELIKTKYVIDVMEHECVNMIDLGKYIVRFSDASGKDMYKCIEFINRSKSILQMKSSKSSEEADLKSCNGHNLNLDPWLIVSYSLMKQEFTTCPFSGGYNMKIRDSNGIDHGCNFRDLPMRFESECHTGDGIMFDFRSSNCIGQMPMKQLQKAICVTHWRRDGDVFTVLRKDGEDTLWCLRIPARSSYSGTITMYLYEDLVCPVGDRNDLLVDYFTLDLELVPQHSLCADEHDNCQRLPCNGFFDTQCLKSCGKCDPNVYPTACDFPRRYRGEWFIKDRLGVSTINISEARFHIDRMGDFDCVTFPGSPSRKTKLFTTLSVFNNGCRPRFTCVGFNKPKPNMLGYKIGTTLIWPLDHQTEDIGATICDAQLFRADSPPIRDAYRPYNDVYKPIVTMSNIQPQSCKFISSYIFNATLNFASGNICNGVLYQDCSDDSRMRMEYSGCWYEPEFLDFNCIGSLEGRYWERMIVIQNTKNPYDTRCVIFSDLKQDRIIMLKSGECDKYSWMYVDAGVRQPLIDFTVAMENTHCRHISTTTTTHAPPEPVNDAWSSDTYNQKYKNDLVVRKISSAHVTLTTLPMDKYSSLQQDKPKTKNYNKNINDNEISSFLVLTPFSSLLWLMCFNFVVACSF